MTEKERLLQLLAEEWHRLQERQEKDPNFYQGMVRMKLGETISWLERAPESAFETEVPPTAEDCEG